METLHSYFIGTLDPLGWGFKGIYIGVYLGFRDSGPGALDLVFKGFLRDLWGFYGAQGL